MDYSPLNPSVLGILQARILEWVAMTSFRGSSQPRDQAQFSCMALHGKEGRFFTMLLLLSCFSRIRLCATPEMAAHQAPLSLGFSRKEHWSGLPFASPMHESEVTQSCPTLRDPLDCNLPGSSVHGIFQARVLEWSAIACLRLELVKRKMHI